ncbi:MAG: histidine phosphatase family protein [Clostridium sp.]|nr:histidine phosphatase family protein [Clostridium sp.]MCQ5166518.1 histidine phosphatase family protein [Roseburia hominis]
MFAEDNGRSPHQFVWTYGSEEKAVNTEIAERIKEHEKGPDGNNRGIFQKRWADHDYHEEGVESISIVQNRNIGVLNEILSDNKDKDVVVVTYGTNLSTIFDFYDNSFGSENFLRIIDWMPYIIELDFEGNELVGKQEHCHVEKEFQGKQRADKR